MPSIAIVDSGALIAFTNRADPHHSLVSTVLSRRDLEIVVPVLCIAEVCYMLAERGGPGMESRFLARCSQLDIRAPEPEDWDRIAQLAFAYRDMGLGGTDASVIALAERLGTDIVLTLDERHFRAVQAKHTRSFRLLRDFA